MPINKKMIDKKIAEALCFIINNPLIYFSEQDLQSLFINKFMEIKDLNPYKKLFYTDCIIGNICKGRPSKNKYKTMLIHKEYGHPNIDNARMDLVIFNENDTQLINDPLNLKIKGRKKYISPDYAFEFGTEKSCSSKDSFYMHLNNDLKKIISSDFKNAAYIIHLQRRTSINKKIIENMEKVIADLIDNNKNSQLMNHIKLIIGIINIGNNSECIKKDGKFKLFINSFKSVNKSKIKEEIEKLLSVQKELTPEI